MHLLHLFIIFIDFLYLLYNSLLAQKLRNPRISRKSKLLVRNHGLSWENASFLEILGSSMSGINSNQGRLSNNEELEIDQHFRQPCIYKKDRTYIIIKHMEVFVVSWQLRKKPDSWKCQWGYPT